MQHFNSICLFQEKDDDNNLTEKREIVLQSGDIKPNTLGFITLALITPHTNKTWHLKIDHCKRRFLLETLLMLVFCWGVHIYVVNFHKFRIGQVARQICWQLCDVAVKFLMCEVGRLVNKHHLVYEIEIYRNMIELVN